MESRSQQLNQFFDQYAARFNEAIRTGKTDIEATTNAFAHCFVEASPLGVNCGKNDEQFRTAIPQGYAFYKSVGITAMNILSKEISLLDEFHAMVKVHWESVFTRKDKTSGSIEFDVFYFVQSLNNTHKIFAYITGDEQAALKANGLI